MTIGDGYKDIAILLIPLALFLYFVLQHIELPGLQFDEIFYMPPIITLLYNSEASDYVMINPSVIYILGKPFPLMFNYYTSFLQTYITLPIFWIFGISVETIRGATIALASIGLIFFGYFTKHLSGSRFIVLASMILFALDVHNIFYTHASFAHSALMMALKGPAMLLLLLWWKGGKTNYLYIAVFLIGLGITDRASFLWVPMALIPTAFLLYRKKTLSIVRKCFRTKRQLFYTFVAFVMGASVFIAFNIANFGGTFGPMISGFRDTQLGHVNNLDFLGNFYTRIQMFADVLSGGYLLHIFTGDYLYQTNSWNLSGSPMSWLVPLAIIWYLFSYVKNITLRKNIDHQASFLVFMILITLVLMSFTPTFFRGNQYFLFYPFPHILVAYFINDSLNAIQIKWNLISTKIAGYLKVAIIIVISLISVSQISMYYRMFVETGGEGRFSDAIYDIVDYLEKFPGKKVVSMDWGFDATILVLSEGTIVPIRNYYKMGRLKPDEISKMFTEEYVFLFHSQEYTIMPYATIDFKKALNITDSKADTIVTFRQRDGRDLAHLLSVIPDKIE